MPGNRRASAYAGHRAEVTRNELQLRQAYTRSLLQCDVNPLRAFAFAGAPDEFAFAGELGDADVDLPESVFAGGV